MIAVILAAGGESLGIEKLAFERLIPQGHTYSVVDASDYFSCELDTVEDFENAKSIIHLD